MIVRCTEIRDVADDPHSTIESGGRIAEFIGCMESGNVDVPPLPDGGSHLTLLDDDGEFESGCYYLLALTRFEP